jgi:phosphatidylinositol alpha-mannosyltransferase
MVGTFHVSSPKQKAIYAIGPILEPIVEKLTARIAVSESARQTLKDHFDTDAVVIPNGIESSQYSSAQPTIHWRNPHTLGFIGRFEEPRKGLQILLDALPIIARFIPDVRLLIAGPGDGDELIKKLDIGLRNRIVFLGFLTEQEKASFLKSITVYVAPNTGGESFGIILTEALSAGTPVVASDIPAFQAVLEKGDAGLLFKNGDSPDLAKVLIGLLRDEQLQQNLSIKGKLSSQKYDWQVVADQILSVYEMAMAGNKKVGLISDSRFWNRR